MGHQSSLSEDLRGRDLGVYKAVVTGITDQDGPS
jgi:hypothetical protein